VKIDNILRVDLDGDGEDEVLISATKLFQEGRQGANAIAAGSYSMVLLRRVGAGKVARNSSQANSTRRLIRRLHKKRGASTRQTRTR